MADRFKRILRKTYKGVRESLPIAFQHDAAANVFTQIRALPQYRKAKRIALYQAVQGEINLHALWHSAPLQGKFCYFPSLNDDKTLSFLPASPATAFKKNRFQIEEPDVDKENALSPDQLDLLFVPLLAFDTQGTRLGMGAGYYDRTLAHYPETQLIGIAYDFQRAPFLKPQPWDIPLTAIITPNHIYWSPK
ncbi:MAG: 5-formyltetrahydrofolate cyclo-ligase [Tatlockia sp.]|jgi:5-formyltetrahydrofolate cyclo-ligase